MKLRGTRRNICSDESLLKELDGYIYHYFGEDSSGKNKLRIEGKEYIVKDGDVMHSRFNV